MLAPRSKLFFKDGSTYEGQVERDQPHGLGTLKLVTGEQYTGDFVYGIRSGKGKLNFVVHVQSDQESYEGEFLNNQQHGEGVLKWADGCRYRGQFQNNMRTGRGKFTWVENNIVQFTYNGMWLNNQKHGLGIKTIMQNGETIEGMWIHDKRFGMQIRCTTNGEIYEELWESDVVKLSKRIPNPLPDTETCRGCKITDNTIYINGVVSNAAIIFMYLFNPVQVVVNNEVINTKFAAQSGQDTQQQIQQLQQQIQNEISKNSGFANRLAEQQKVFNDKQQQQANQYNQLLADNQQLQAINKQNVNIITAKSVENKELQQQLKQLTQKCGDLEQGAANQLNYHKREVDDINAQIKQQKDDIAKLTRQLKDCQNAAIQTKAQHQQLLDEQNIKIINLEQENTQKTATLTQNAVQIKQLEQQVQTELSKQRDLSQQYDIKINVLSKEKLSLQEQLVQANKQIADVEKMIAKLNQEISDAKVERTQLLQVINDLQSAAKQNNAAKHGNESVINEQNNAIDSLNKQIIALDQKLQSLQNVQGLYDDVSLKYQLQTKRITELEQQLNHDQKQVTNLKQASNDSDAKYKDIIDKLNEQINTLKKLLEQCKQQCETQIQQFQSQQKQNQNEIQLQAEIKKLKDDAQLIEQKKKIIIQQCNDDIQKLKDIHAAEIQSRTGLMSENLKQVTMQQEQERATVLKQVDQINQLQQIIVQCNVKQLKSDNQVQQQQKQIDELIAKNTNLEHQVASQAEEKNKLSSSQQLYAMQQYGIQLPYYYSVNDQLKNIIGELQHELQEQEVPKKVDHSLHRETLKRLEIENLKLKKDLTENLNGSIVEGFKSCIACKICGSMFNSHAEFVIHAKTVCGNNKVIKCPMCDLIFSTPELFYLHVEQHVKK